MNSAGFKTLFPEFEREADARVQMFIDQAAPHFDVERWDDMYESGLANFVAHKITLANMIATQGAAKFASSNDQLMKKVGDVQVTRDSELLNRQADNPFLLTPYGKEYLYLRGLVSGGIYAV